MLFSSCTMARGPVKITMTPFAGRVVLCALHLAGVRLDVPYVVPVRGIAVGLDLVIVASAGLLLAPKSGSGLAALPPPVKAN